MHTYVQLQIYIMWQPQVEKEYSTVGGLIQLVIILFKLLQIFCVPQLLAVFAVWMTTTYAYSAVFEKNMTLLVRKVGGGGGETGINNPPA